MKPRTIKTLQEAKADLDRSGISVKSWAIQHGFTPNPLNLTLNTLIYRHVSDAA